MKSLTSAPMPSDMSHARKAMIDSQLRTSGINDEYVLARINAVPREDFVPEASRALAYIDRAIPLGEGQYLSSPLVHAMLLSEAAPVAEDEVLVVENGNGYLAELIRPLVARLSQMSAHEAAHAKRGKTYSLILIDGAVEQLPKTLTKQLREEGRIVTGLVLRDVTRLAHGRKIADDVALQPLADIGIPRLAAFAKPKERSFP